MFFIILNSLLGLFVALVITIKLVKYAQLLNLAERIGLGLVGAASVLVLAVRLDVYERGTPFTTWSTTLWLIGILIYMCGRLSRHVRHDRRNRETAGVLRQSIREHRAGVRR